MANKSELQPTENTRITRDEEFLPSYSAQSTCGCLVKNKSKAKAFQFLILWFTLRHVLPRDLVDTFSENTETSLANGNPIVLYLHGNSGSRATGHRVELYKLLQFHNYHVIAFDYRGKFTFTCTCYGCIDVSLGFADSSQVLMSENGATIDAIRVYEYIRLFSGKSTVIVWGHSLGSA